MKIIITIFALIFCFNLQAQFSNRFNPNLLFKRVTDDFWYSGSYPYWNVYKEAQSDSTTIYELRAFDDDGNLVFRMKIDNAVYCKTCGELICTKNNESFVLFDQIKNN